MWRRRREEEEEDEEEGARQGNSDAEFNVLSSMTSTAERLARIERSSCRLRDLRMDYRSCFKKKTLIFTAWRCPLTKAQPP